MMTITLLVPRCLKMQMIHEFDLRDLGIPA